MRLRLELGGLLHTHARANTPHAIELKLHNCTGVASPAMGGWGSEAVLVDDVVFGQWKGQSTSELPPKLVTAFAPLPTSYFSTSGVALPCQNFCFSGVHEAVLGYREYVDLEGDARCSDRSAWCASLVSLAASLAPRMYRKCHFQTSWCHDTGSLAGTRLEAWRHARAQLPALDGFQRLRSLLWIIPGMLIHCRKPSPKLRHDLHVLDCRARRLTAFASGPLARQRWLLRICRLPSGTAFSFFFWGGDATFSWRWSVFALDK